MTSYCQYKIRCSYCDSDSFLISTDSTPIIYKCNGCSRYVIVNGSKLFTVREEFFMRMAIEFNIRCCGQVVTCAGKKEYTSNKKLTQKSAITEDDLKKLHEFLVKADDSSDIIEKL